MMILKFCTITKNLDYALEELLYEVIFLIIRDIFRVSSEETKQCVLDGGIVYGKRTIWHRGFLL